MRWFRVHTSILHNAKFQTLADPLKVRLLNLWCIAAESDGILPEIANVAFQLRLTTEEALDTIRQLASARFLDETEGQLQVHDWAEHQYLGSSTARVKRHRAKKRNADETRNVTPRETQHETHLATRSETPETVSETHQIQNQNQNQTQNRPNPFEAFQEAYPEPKRRVRVESSCRAYVGRVQGQAGEHKRLMEGLERHNASAQWQQSLADNGGKYIPTMERFICDGLYLDYPPAAVETPASDYEGEGY